MDEAETDWQEWYDRHGPALLLFARQLTRSLAEAEDAVHDGFIRFWKRRHEVDDPSAYLYRAVRHAAMDQGRSVGRRREREQARPKDVASPSPWRHAAQDEADQLLRRAIDRLPLPQRQVLVLRIWGGLTFDQAATTLDLPRSTAAARYSAALASLRELLPAEETLR